LKKDKEMERIKNEKIKIQSKDQIKGIQIGQVEVK